MKQRAELKTRARELERNDQVEAALELYRRIATESTDGGSGPLWARIGDLQERLEQRDSAADSYSRAVAAFADSGQTNNAIALCCALLRLDPESPGAQLRLGELSLAEGYRAFARDGIGAFARQVATTEEADGALEPVSAFLHRFPDEDDLWRDWIEELVGLGKEDEAVAILLRLGETARAQGLGTTAARLNEGALKIRPSATAADSAESTTTSEASIGGGEAIPSEYAELPLIESHTVAGGAGELDIPRLQGFEPTRSVDSEDADDLDTGPLPYFDTTAAGSDSPAQESAGTDDPLPLLGFGLEEEDADEPRDEGGSLPLLDPLGVERDPAADEGMVDDSLPLLGNELFDYVSDAPPPGDVAYDEAPAPDEPPSETFSPIASGTAPGGKPEPADAEPAEPANFQWVVEELLSLSGVEIVEADPGTHYDLGLAFKEMGRFEEALANLALAISGGHDPVATLEVVGEMLLDRGQHDLVTRLLSGIPGAGERPAAELLGVHYWLARAAEDAGRRGEARRALELVVAVDPDFRDASARADNMADPHF